MVELNTNTIMINSPPMSAIVLSMQGVLQQNHDIRGGKKTIHLNKSNYFRKLDAQTDEQFAAMVEMAPVYILYPKVVDGFVGTIFAKEPTTTGVDFTDEQKEQNKNVDMLGNSVEKFSESIASEVIENGFCASMNDYSTELKRPFLRLIKPEQFISFRTSNNDGYPKISQFVFVEQVESEDPENEFDTLVANKYTVLDLAENPNNDGKYNYRVRLYQGVPAKTQYNTTSTEKMYLISETFPMKGGKYFDEIPLTIHGIESNNFTIKKSLLQDISDMNISVMQRVVDQVYMLHWTALPTPYIIGSDEKDSPDTIGPSKVWYIENPDAKVGMLEFTGNSARAHQDYIDNLLYIMATTGAQILKKEGVSRETATSVLVRTASQTSLVSTMVKNVSGQLQTALKVQWEWSGATFTDEFSYNLNDDFIKVDMEPNAQIALVKSWLDGAISHETVFNKMKEGEIVPANRTFEEEKALIEKDKPPFFDKEVDAKNAESLAEKNSESGSGNPEEDMSGSNLENGNIDNPLATEQV